MFSVHNTRNFQEAVRYVSLSLYNRIGISCNSIACNLNNSDANAISSTGNEWCNRLGAR